MKQFVILTVALLFARCMTIGKTGYDVATDERSVGMQTGDAQIWAQIHAALLQARVEETNGINP